MRQARFARHGNIVLTVPEAGTAGAYARDACGSKDTVPATARRLVARRLSEAERRRYLR